MMRERMTSAPLLAHPPFVTAFIFFTLLGTLGYGHTGMADRPGLQERNVTHSQARFELNPRFVAGDREFLYLEFTGNPEEPMPWDYRLMLSDRDGHAAVELFAPGVVDYVIGPKMSMVTLLVVNQAASGPVESVLFEENVQWDLWRLDLNTKAQHLLYHSKSETLTTGYAKLGVAELPNFNQDRLLTLSPNKEDQILLAKESSSGKHVINFYRVAADGGQDLILTSEPFNTYSHSGWLPPVVWLSEHEILTLRFRHKQTEAFPQSEGVFSIVRVGLSGRDSEIVFESGKLRPFARMSLSANRQALFFQQVGRDDSTELWRLNLQSGKADMIYWTIGALGEVRSSFDGASLLFSRLESDNFDIIRLDLKPHSRQRLAQN